MSTEIIERDLGWNRIEHELKKFRKSATLVGLFGEGGDPGENLAARGAVHEYGSLDGRIPKRSFMRSAFDEGRKELEKLIADLYSQILEGKMDAKRALGILGEVHVGQIKEKITKGPFAPLSENYRIHPSGIPVTEASRPLIDTSQMKDSITHQEQMRG